MNSAGYSKTMLQYLKGERKWKRKMTLLERNTIEERAAQYSTVQYLLQ